MYPQYTAVLRAVLLCTHEKIRNFRGALESWRLRREAAYSRRLATMASVPAEPAHSARGTGGR